MFSRFLTHQALRAPGGQCKRIEKRVFPKHESMYDTFDKELRKSNTRMAYAKAGGEVVGYIVFVRGGNTGKIIKLCVAPHQQRRGIGAALLDKGLSALGVPPRATGSWRATTAGSTDHYEDREGLSGEKVDKDAVREGVESVHVPPADQGERGIEGRNGGAGAGEGGGASERQVKGPTRTKGGVGGVGSSRKTPEARPPALVQLHVDPERVGALRLYQSRGFAEVRRIVDYYCEGRDALYCELLVHSSVDME